MSAKKASSAAEKMRRSIWMQDAVKSVGKDKPVSVLALYVARHGTVMERKTMAMSFDYADTFGLPELNETKNLKIAKENMGIIKEVVDYIFGSIGKKYGGDADQLPHFILTEYGSFTIIDLIKFAENVKRGEYFSKYNESTKQVSHQTFVRWLGEYAIKKNDALQSIIMESTRPVNPEKISTRLSEMMTAQRVENARRIRLESEAEKVRVQFARYDVIRKDDQEIRIKKGIALDRFLLIHYANVYAATKKATDVESWGDAYRNLLIQKWSSNKISKKENDALLKMKSKEFIYQAKKVIRANPPQGILREAFWDKRKTPSQQRKLVSRLVDRHIQTFRIDYYRYLESVIKEPVTAPLMLDQFLSVKARLVSAMRGKEDAVTRFFLNYLKD